MWRARTAYVFGSRKRGQSSFVHPHSPVYSSATSRAWPSNVITILGRLAVLFRISFGGPP